MTRLSKVSVNEETAEKTPGSKAMESVESGEGK